MMIVSSAAVAERNIDATPSDSGGVQPDCPDYDPDCWEDAPMPPGGGGGICTIGRVCVMGVANN